MANPIINFIKKTYKILIVVVAAIIFFLGYNTYLVDRSLANLRVALDRISDAKTIDDAKKLASALDYSLLMEVTSPELQTSSIAKIELAKDILSRPKDMSQLNDVKFALKEVIKQKEKERPAILVALDKINKIFAPAVAKVSKGQSEDKIGLLKERLGLVEGKTEKQEIYYELASIYTQLSRFEEAKEAYNKLIELDPEAKLAKKAKFNLAWNEKSQGNLDEAAKQFEVLSQTTGDEKLSSFSKYQAAEVYRKKGDYEKAFDTYQQISTQKKGQDKDLSQIAEFQTGYTYLYALEEHGKAKDMFIKAKTVSEGSNMSKYIESDIIPRILDQYHRQGFELLSEGYQSSLSKRFLEALEVFDKALAINPNDGVSCIGKALVFFWLKETDKALDFAREAVKLLPENEIASVNLGYIYIELGMVEEAINEYRRFISSTDRLTSRGYYNLGYAYTLQRKLDEAVDSFRRATAIDPQFTYAFNNLGWALWQMRRYSEAVDAFERAIKIDNKFLDAIFNLGLVYISLGRYEDAKKRFEKVAELDPLYPETQTYLREIERILQPVQR